MKPITPVVPNLPIWTDIAESQPQYLTLPSVISSYTSDNVVFAKGIVTNRWKLSWKERIQVFLTGNIWHQSLTYGDSLQPIMMHTTCPLKASDFD